MFAVISEAVSEASAPSPQLILLSGLLAVGLALIHLLASRLRFLHALPRNRWLSFGSGVSVAYVFVHILPDLSEAQETIRESLNTEIGFLEHHVYLVALLGLAAFYGLERAANLSRHQNRKTSNKDVTSPGFFWLHIASFAVYNALIGYLLVHREVPGFTSLLLFSIAMALHFVVNDYGLREHHKKMYDQTGRWILATAIVAGWVIGSGTKLSQSAIAVLFAFLAGSVVLNVLKEELPEDRESQFWAFALGAGGYAILLLMV
jgi:zinc transporter ZupT